VVELQKDWDIHADSDDYTSIQCGWYNRKFSINSSLPIEIIDPDGNSHTYYPKKGKFKAGSQIRSHGKWSFRSLVPGRVASITFHCPVEN
jgi:ribosomal protein L31